MKIRIIAALAVAVLIGVPAQAGTTIADPVAFVQSVYQKLATDRDYSEPEDIYTPRLAALFTLEKKEADDEVGRLDFDFWVNAQDWSISSVKIGGETVDQAPDRKIVTAKFENTGRKEIIQFYFENTKEGWKLDDVRSAGADAWTLSLLLKYGWPADK